MIARGSTTTWSWSTSVFTLSALLGLGGAGCGLVWGIEDLSGDNLGNAGGAGGNAGGAGGNAGGAGGNAGGAGGAGGGPPCTMDCPGDVLWARGNGSPGADLGARVAVAPNGDIFVVGEQSGPIDFGGGLETGSAFVIKLGPAGKHIWSTAIPNCSRPHVAVGADSTPVLTAFHSDTVTFGPDTYPGAGAFVVKLSAGGAPIWSKGFAGNTISANAIAVSSNGDVAVAGDFKGLVDFGGATGQVTSSGSGSDIFVVKVMASGNDAWTKTYGAGGSTQNVAQGVAFGGNGGNEVAITGRSQGMLDFGMGPVPMGAGVFFTRLSAVGDTLSARHFPNAAGLGIDHDSIGGFVMTGLTTGMVDFGDGPIASGSVFVAKFDAMSQLSYSSSFKGLGNVGVAVAVNDDIMITGTFGGTVNAGGEDLMSAGGADIFVAKLAGTDGAHVWSERFGGPGDDKALGLGVGDKNVVLTGSFSQDVTFGTTLLESAGDTDIWVAKLSR
jgi:hypothetical protein